MSSAALQCGDSRRHKALALGRARQASGSLLALSSVTQLHAQTLLAIMCCCHTPFCQLCGLCAYACPALRACFFIPLPVRNIAFPLGDHAPAFLSTACLAKSSGARWSILCLSASKLPRRPSRSGRIGRPAVPLVAQSGLKTRVEASAAFNQVSRRSRRGDHQLSRLAPCPAAAAACDCRTPGRLPPAILLGQAQCVAWPHLTLTA